MEVFVPRHLCRIAHRTFSLLHDSLLPYHGPTAGQILEWLHAMVVDRTPPSRLARLLDLPRKTLCDLKRKFLQAAPALRIPGTDQAPDAAELLKHLAGQTGEAIVHLFRDWKQKEPKHSIVGIYSR